MEDIKGELIESYGAVKIYKGFPYSFYELKKPDVDSNFLVMSKAMSDAVLGKVSVEDLSRVCKLPRAFINAFNDKIVREVAVAGALDSFPKKQFTDNISKNLLEIIKQGLPNLKKPEELAESVIDHSIGYGFLSQLIRDQLLEEIMVNSVNTPIFVFHRKYGMCKTNQVMGREDFLESLVTKIAHTVNKPFNADNPLLDARLADGSRINATLKAVSPAGISLTIRKFTEVPFSIVDLISKNTISSELAAFFWVMIEGLNIEPMNIIVTGGSGSGKTTTMNALTTFIPYSERIITIEDTLELNLGSRDNWIQLETKPAIGESPAVTMDDLLKNSLRMRPDRIIVGEVRGPEAQTLFVAMDTGHEGCMGTLHSNSARELLTRLREKPMSVPDSMLPLLNLILVQYRIYDKKKGAMRRVAQVAELSRMDEKVLLSNVFEWNRKTDKIERTAIPSNILEMLSNATGMTKNELKQEMVLRQRVLDWMLKKGIKDNLEVEKVIQRYYVDPETILKEVLKEV